MALGGALGGVALALGGYEAVGLSTLAWLLALAALVHWPRPRKVPTSRLIPAKPRGSVTPV